MPEKAAKDISGKTDGQGKMAFTGQVIGLAVGEVSGVPMTVCQRHHMVIFAVPQVDRRFDRSEPDAPILIIERKVLPCASGAGRHGVVNGLIDDKPGLGVV